MTSVYRQQHAFPKSCKTSQLTTPKTAWLTCSEFTQFNVKTHFLGWPIYFVTTNETFSLSSWLSRGMVASQNSCWNGRFIDYQKKVQSRKFY